MWVLEARYKAEKVWYAIIWEKTKEDPNVIDYNINEEITKDTSAVFNANNDTTTGMANVIPWVNAPKLIAQTSILWIDFNANYLWWVYYKFYNTTATSIPSWEEVSVPVDEIESVTWLRWPYKFNYVEWKWIVMPAQWTYKLECTYYSIGWGWSPFTYSIDTLVWWKVAHSSASISSETSETFNIDANKWQWVRFIFNYDNQSSSTRNEKPWVWAKISKL